VIEVARNFKAMDDTIYIGDAIYAHYDGYGIELRLNDHRNECAIYLEPECSGATTSGTAFRN